MTARLPFLVAIVSVFFSQPAIAQDKTPTTWDHLDISNAKETDGYLCIKPQSNIRTKQEYSGPIEITVIAKTEKNNIRLHAFNGACVIFNWEVKRNQLRVNRPDGNDKLESGSLATADVRPLNANKWYTIRWRITPEGMEIAVDNEVVFSERKAYNLSAKRPVLVTSGGSIIDVKSFEVKPGITVFRKRPLEDWIKQLKERDVNVHPEAIRGVVEYGALAVPALVELWKHNAPSRGLVENILAQIGPAANDAVKDITMNALYGPLKTIYPVGPGTFSYHMSAYTSVLNIIQPTAAEWGPLAISALKDKNEKVRDAAVFLVSHLGPKAKALVPQLIDAASDNRSRWVVIEALGRMGPDAKSAVPLLIKTLDESKESKAFFMAIRALGNIGPESKVAVPKLIQILDDNQLGSHHVSIRTATIITLGQIGPDAKAAIPAITRRMQDNKRYAEDALKKIGK